MLIQKKQSPGDILGFKMNSGEEILAKLVSETDTYFEVNKPLTLIPTGQGLALNQSMLCVDLNKVNVHLSKSTVAMSGPARKEFADEYIKGTTGIQPVSALLGMK